MKMKVKKENKAFMEYSLTCQKCGKEVKGLNEKQVIYNFGIHYNTHIIEAEK